MFNFHSAAAICYDFGGWEKTSLSNHQNSSPNEDFKGGLRESTVPCKRCGGARLKEFSAELTVIQPDLQRLDQPPLYVCDHAIVCLDCGLVELTIPASDLDRLKKDSSPNSSQIT